ncbi:hypothetical protein [Dehalogenimonas sp. THU2]|uniref:hypothetical protein n=1 Tax=Dehalogenimonas sp. THU2 TaxID=3151121 RepID=UPI00321A5245
MNLKQIRTIAFCGGGFTLAGLVFLAFGSGASTDTNFFLAHAVFGAGGGLGLGLALREKRMVFFLPFLGLVAFPLLFQSIVGIASFLRPVFEFGGSAGIFNYLPTVLLYGLMGSGMGLLYSLVLKRNDLRLMLVKYGALFFALGFLITTPILFFIQSNVWPHILTIIYTIGGVGLGLALYRSVDVEENGSIILRNTG